MTTDCECQKCGRHYSLREDCKPTPFCDECAHGEVNRLAALVDSLGNALRYQDKRWGIYDNKSKQALKAFEELKAAAVQQSQEPSFIEDLLSSELALFKADRDAALNSFHIANKERLAERAAREKADARISELEAECQNHVEHLAPYRQRAEKAEQSLVEYSRYLADACKQLSRLKPLTPTPTPPQDAASLSSPQKK